MIYSYFSIYIIPYKLAFSFSADQYKEDSINAIFFGCYCFNPSKLMISGHFSSFLI